MKKRGMIEFLLSAGMFLMFTLPASCALPPQPEQKKNPPVLSISIPTNQQTVSTNLTIYGSASGSTAIKSVYIKIDNNGFTAADGTETWSHSISLTNGPHTISAFSRDTQDNDSATNEISVTADSSYPIVAVTSPTNNEAVSINITNSGTAYDDSGLEGVYLSVDGGAFSKVTGTTSWSTNFIVSKAAHTFTIYARDDSLHNGSAVMVRTHPMAEQNPYIQAQKLGRGVNMGNCLEAPQEGEWGVSNRQVFYQLIKQAGFDTVRIPIRWSNHALNSSPFTIDAAFFSRVDEIIGWALAEDLKVVINVHHYNEAGHNIYESNTDAEIPRFIAIWQQIASRYKDLSDNLYYELLNEPYTSSTMSYSKYNTLIQNTVNAVRQIDPYHSIIITPLGWDWYAGLQQLTIPTNTNIIATIHFYDPFIFTHQTANWGAASNLSGVLWPNLLPDPTNNVSIPPDVPSWVSSAIIQYNSFDANMAGSKNNINSQFGSYSNWAVNHVPIWIGEFGSFSGDGVSTDMASRVKWTGYVRTTAEKYGLKTCYWEFCSGFGIYGYPSGPWIDGLTNALLSNW